MLPAYLSDAHLDSLIDLALQEDIGDGDVTTEATISAQTQAEAIFLAKESGVAAGLYVAERVFHRLDLGLAVRWKSRDGECVERGAILGRVRGYAHPILSGERLALNIVQRMSGIATATRNMVAAVQPHSARILDTRKTVPGLRRLDKWAVLLGGGENHRTGLFDMILIKDNHIAAAGGIGPAVAAAKRYRQARNAKLEIEVEARTLDEVEEVLAAGGVDRILLDNMVTMNEGMVDVSMLERAVRLIGRGIKTEASGNVTLATAPAIAATGVDYISSGALTHSVAALDISLKVRLT